MKLWHVEIDQIVYEFQNWKGGYPQGLLQSGLYSLPVEEFEHPSSIVCTSSSCKYDIHLESIPDIF